MPIPVLSAVRTVTSESHQIALGLTSYLSSESATPGGLEAPLSHHMFWSSSLIPRLLR